MIDIIDGKRIKEELDKIMPFLADYVNEKTDKKEVSPESLYVAFAYMEAVLAAWFVKELGEQRAVNIITYLHNLATLEAKERVMEQEKKEGELESERLDKKDIYK